MKLNKYGALGMMEWQLNLKAGKATVHIEFKGGFENEYGIHPATFSTKDPIIQNIIERSSYFACGKITLLDSKDLGLSAAELAAKKRKADELAKRVAEQKAKEDAEAAELQKAKEQTAAAVEGADIDEESDIDEEQEVVSDESTDGGGEDTSDGVDSTEATSTAGDGDGSDEELEVVKVTCNQDAKDYLEEHFGAQSGLRNWDTILAVGKANGILFEKE